MKKINDQELLLIKGGAVSASLWNAINDTISLVLDLGRNLGNAINRLFNKKMCNF